MTKVFIVGGCRLIERMFARQPGAKYGFVDNPSDANLLVFTGGSDVTPDYYGDRKHPTTSNNPKRDEEEHRIFRQFQGKPKVGICRGGQFLNVMSGGSLWQDVDQHALGNTHALAYCPKLHWAQGFQNADRNLNLDYDVVQVTSTHHQMMRPGINGDIWGWCQRSTYRDTGRDQQAPSDFRNLPDIEIVYYEDEGSLCFQPHPEYGVESCEKLFFRCLDRAFGY